jgi:serine/threonine protein kinase
MGDVFLAREHGADGVTRRVALKRIRPELSRDERFRELFRHEARVAIRLAHPNIVHVHEVGMAGDDLYLTMEYVEGRTLYDVLRQAAQAGVIVPIEVAMAVALDVARGLHYAHDLRGEDGRPLDIVHRDLSPRNILVSLDGAARILDFGVAKASIALDEREGLELKGKPGYLSPEQARLERVDRRSDIYTLGILLWEMTTGRRLFPASDALQTLALIGRQPIPSPAAIRPLPAGWEGVLRRALAADRDERYQTARALQLDVEEVARAAGHVVSNLPVVSLLAGLFPEVALDLEAEPPRARRPTVLVVDDEPHMLELITRTLRRSVDVRTARSVAEALQALAAAPFDAVLTDERMPEQRGMELLAHVARESPRTARIMITAFADTELMLSAINRGHVDRFVVKPFQPADLASLVEDVLARNPRLRLSSDEPATVQVDQDRTRPDVLAAPPVGAADADTVPGRLGGPPPVALPWESLRHLTEEVREDALSCALLVGVAEQPIRTEEQAAIEWVLERRLPHCWLHVEDRAMALLVPGIATASAAALAAELRDAAFGVLGARLSVAMAELSAGEDLAAAGRRVERAAVDAWREDNRRGP